MFDGDVGGGEKVLRLLDALAGDVLHGGGPGGVFEEPYEVFRRDAGFGGQGLEVDGVGEVVHDVVYGSCDALVAEGGFRGGFLQEAGKELVDDSPRFHFQLVGPHLALQDVVEQSLAVVVCVRVGSRQGDGRVELDEAFEKIPVVWLHRHLEREFQFFEDVVVREFLLIHMDVVMDEAAVACGGMGGEGWYQVQVSGAEGVCLPVDGYGGFALDDIVYACESTANVGPVPV